HYAHRLGGGLECADQNIIVRHCADIEGGGDNGAQLQLMHALAVGHAASISHTLPLAGVSDSECARWPNMTAPTSAMSANARSRMVARGRVTLAPPAWPG